MNHDRIDQIEKWFTGEHADGDFIPADRRQSYAVIGPTAKSKRVIYCTKTGVASRAIADDSVNFDHGLISRFGLLLEADVAWLSDIIGKRELIFIGDLDPVDLMIFSWLREQLPSIKLQHHGINDRFIAGLNVLIPKTYRIPLCSSEKAAFSVLNAILNDIKETLGPECYEILQGGYKIELEAVATALGAAAPLFRMVHE
jgi:hypothetical protein